MGVKNKLILAKNTLLIIAAISSYCFFGKSTTLLFQGFISIFDAVSIVCATCGENDIIVSDAGSSYYVTSMMFTKRSNQRYITSD